MTIKLQLGRLLIGFIGLMVQLAIASEVECDKVGVIGQPVFEIAFN